MNSSIIAMPTVVALRPVSSEARVGEHSAVVWDCDSRTAALGDARHRRHVHQPAEAIPRRDAGVPSVVEGFCVQHPATLCHFSTIGKTLGHILPIFGHNL